MTKKTLLLFALVMLLAFLGGSAFAQTFNAPDAVVNGKGAILVNPGDVTTKMNIGTFEVNIARYGDALTGAFKYAESVGPYGSVVNRIYSKTLTSLVVTGNTAVITANGYWNNMPARLTITVLDDLAGDNFSIRAVELLMTADVRPPRVYEQGGGLIYGDIRVFSQQAYAKGSGMIGVTSSTVGRFTFSVQKVNGLTRGSLSYAEFNPFITTAIIQPKVKIYCPAAEKLVVSGGRATFCGKGVLNGKPAWIEVSAVDNPISTVAQTDTFTIKATPLVNDSTSSVYYASGPLIQGDIVVYPKP